MLTVMKRSGVDLAKTATYCTTVTDYGSQTKHQ